MKREFVFTDFPIYFPVYNNYKYLCVLKNFGI